MTTEISTNTAPARGLALASFDDAWRFWQMVAKTDFAPKDFKGKPEACLLAGQHGAEIGIGPMQSLQCIAVINGRPSIWGDAALALVQSSHVCEYVTESVEGDGEQMVATCTAKRRGYPSATVVRFTVADAKKAGLWGKTGPWSQYPKRMLQMRARGFALRDCFPDVLKGLVTAEEAQDYQTTEAPATVARAQEPAKATAQVAQSPVASAPEASVYEKAERSIARATTVDRLDDIRRKVEERFGEGSLTKFERDELAKSILDKANAIDNGVEHFDGNEVEAEANAR